MEIFMRNIPYTADDVKLTLQLQSVLHSPLFDRLATSPGLPINFKIYLFPDKRYRRHPHSGSGTLTLPSEEIGHVFLTNFGGTRSIRVDDRYISFARSNKPPRTDTLGEVRLLPYRDPRAIRDAEKRQADLSGDVILQDVQFAWQCRDDSLSVEWQWNEDDRESSDYDFPFNRLFTGESIGPSYSLVLDDETREVVVKKCEGSTTHTIAMRYSRIEAVETDSSAKTILLFLETPPSFEKGTINPLEGVMEHLGLFDSGTKEKRQKLTHLNDEHALVAPFTWNVLRLVCDSLASLAEFKRIADVADVANLRVHDRQRPAMQRGLFHPKVLRRMQEWLRTLDWSVAFQCEALHRSLLLDTVELLALRSSIEALFYTRGSRHTTQVIRQFGLHLRDLPYQEDEKNVRSCFDQAMDEIDQGGTSRELHSTESGIFQCLHVNFTPTTMTLRGPFPDTSNRILRKYPNNQDCFLRVSFTDEDHLKFRFDRRKVDGPEFIQRRVGTILKDGFELCGRRFEFLAYSQSALKQYTVWFVTPFLDRQGRQVDAEHVRGTIGSSWSRELRCCPARFAARLSQAFTATESAMFVEPEQIERVPDIERNGFCFSDGNGPLSRDMADAIHGSIQRGAGRTGLARRTPSVFQIRIQGAKGVLSVDPTLSGLKIGLRPSMVKFESIHDNDIEIARSFNKPGKFFLNRPLVMILAGLGVDVNTLLQLQRDAVEETRASIQSLRGAARLLETHGLGSAFALPSTFLNLRKLGVEFEQDLTPSGLRDAFMERCLQFVVHHVLREIKFRARVPVPESWKLVGIVDVHNILEPNQIYACIARGEGAAPEYLKGPILISKSPTIHPGDVQIAEAIGVPPVGSPLHALINCVVFSQRGDRPLPNKLSGSDLDGDEYDLILLRSLHPPKIVDPGQYSSTPRLILDRESTIEDVADFVVNFINNDMLGIVATNFLLIADANPKGIFAENCQKLAELHSWAVDFPKNGIPVPIDEIPQSPLKVKPDWSAPEISTRLDANYYESKSALGKMFRDIRLPPLSTAVHESRAQRRRRMKQEKLSVEDTFSRLSLDSNSFNDPISARLQRRLAPLVDVELTEELTLAMSDLFDHFAAELEHICFAYTLSRKATSRLTEEEVLMGTIIANSTQPRIRRDNTAAMRDETSTLVRRIWKELEGGENATLEDWINRSWTAWKVSILKKDLFGSKSFGWVALRAIFEVIKSLED